MIPRPVRRPRNAWSLIKPHISFSIRFTRSGSGSESTFAMILSICSISRSIISSINRCPFCMVCAYLPHSNSAFLVKGFFTNDTRFTSIRRQESPGERMISPQGFVDVDPKPSSSYISAGVIFLAVSQNRTPGSALLCAHSMSASQTSVAQTSSAISGFTESTGQRCSYFWPRFAAFINSSVTRTDTLAPVTFVRSCFILMKSITCGW